MVAFVVDNSVAIAWSLKNQATEYTERLLTEASLGLLHTAFIWPAEFANVINVVVRRGMITEERGSEIVAFARDFDFIVDRPPDSPTLYRLCREHNLSAYDAAYLELAMRLNMPLATRDADLASAAKKLNLFFA